MPKQDETAELSADSKEKVPKITLGECIKEKMQKRKFEGSCPECKRPDILETETLFSKEPRILYVSFPPNHFDKVNKVGTKRGRQVAVKLSGMKTHDTSSNSYRLYAMIVNHNG